MKKWKTGNIKPTNAHWATSKWINRFRATNCVALVDPPNCPMLGSSYITLSITSIGMLVMSPFIYSFFSPKNLRKILPFWKNLWNWWLDFWFSWKYLIFYGIYDDIYFGLCLWNYWLHILKTDSFEFFAWVNFTKKNSLFFI